MSSPVSSSADDERRHGELVAMLDRIAFALEQIAQSTDRATQGPREVLAAQLRNERAAASAVESGSTGRKSKDPK
jgi:hypothetical protein